MLPDRVSNPGSLPDLRVSALPIELCGVAYCLRKIKIKIKMLPTAIFVWSLRGNS